MDTTLPSQPPVQTIMPTVTHPAQPVPVSDQPLTLDPNQMPVEPLPLRRVAVQIATPAVPAVQPVGGHKERAPALQAPVGEYLRPSSIEPQLPPEVAEAGIEVTPNSEQPQLDDSHKAAGIEPAREAIPVVIPQTTSIYLPYSPADAKKVEKESSISESRHWLAQLTEYIIHKFQSIRA